MTNKPREFWLVTFSSGKIQLSETQVTFETEYYSPGDSRPTKPQGIMKVVEAQAYQALLEQAERMVETLRLHDCLIGSSYFDGEDRVVTECNKCELLKSWQEFKK